jgi:hypothetical protein
VDGFIFGRVEHLVEVELARLRRLSFAVVDFDPGPSIQLGLRRRALWLLRGAEASH